MLKPMQSILDELAQRVREAAASKTALAISGGGSKSFYGNPVSGEPLDVTPYRGIVEYEPSELVLSVRAGTPLAEVETALAEQGQMLAFEPPRFGPAATIGGCVAAGLAGPARAYRGSVRDFVLGTRIIDGNGDDLRFGGKVIKNVAGYDISRLMTGSLGTLGVITEISFKVLPKPAQETTLEFEMGDAKAIETLNRWAGQPLPLSASCHLGGRLWVRLSGSERGVAAAREKLGGAQISEGDAFWQSVREQTHPAFAAPGPIWRVSLPATSSPLGVSNTQVLEWGGALRWLIGDLDAARLRKLAAERGGHVTYFRGGGNEANVFHPLQPGVAAIHERLKRTFDPAGILNPGRMYRISAPLSSSESKSDANQSR